MDDFEERTKRINEAAMRNITFALDVIEKVHFPIDMRTPGEKDLDDLCENHEIHCWHETTEGDDQRIVEACCLCAFSPCDRVRNEER